ANEALRIVCLQPIEERLDMINAGIGIGALLGIGLLVTAATVVEVYVRIVEKFVGWIGIFIQVESLGCPKECRTALRRLHNDIGVCVDRTDGIDRSLGSLRPGSGRRHIEWLIHQPETLYARVSLERGRKLAPKVGKCSNW